MLPVRVLACALIATPLFAQSPAPAKPGGLAILQKMSRQYAAAKTWYIAATLENTSWNSYTHDWSKTVMIGAVSGNRYHFEGHSFTGSALHVSNGTTAWDFHPDSHDYTREPAPAHGYKQHYPIPMNETAAARAADLLKQLSGMADRFTAATRLPDQTITLNGHKIPCYVLRVTSAHS